MKLVANILSGMPEPIKEQVYIWSGRYEAIAARKLEKAKTERIAEWVVSLYPQRKYPAVAVGSSNGALTHVWAALGIPWLPQTFLIPVARSGPHPDEPAQDVKWAEEWAPVFLKANPDVQLHHMHDPNQDRLMIQRMTYFRVKRLWLGQAYERFIQHCLEPGGTIFIVECGLKWPTKKLGERHIFQFGALGGATPDEYYHGGKRVEDYLTRYNSHRKRWEPPAPDGDRPEAEWGFEPQLRADIEQFATRHGFPIRRIVFKEPEHASPLVADFYQWWNRQRTVPHNRLLVESFIVMEPYWTVRTGSVPFWMVFNKLPSAQALEDYLNSKDSFDEIYMMLFSHGVESIGLTPIERWRRILGRANKAGKFVGVDESAYPRDFAIFVRYYFDLKRKIRSRYPMPPPVTLNQLDDFLQKAAGSYAVQWLQP
ncbi:MAG: hypothetical protein ACREQ7_14000 [Candidatus Binatia bacterium]